jgi:hypothetical protein
MFRSAPYRRYGGHEPEALAAIGLIGSDPELKGIHISGGLSNIAGNFRPRRPARPQALLECAFLTVAPAGMDTVLAPWRAFRMLPEDNYVLGVFKRFTASTDVPPGESFTGSDCERRPCALRCRRYLLWYPGGTGRQRAIAPRCQTPDYRFDRRWSLVLRQPHIPVISKSPEQPIWINSADYFTPSLTISLVLMPVFKQIRRRGYL